MSSYVTHLEAAIDGTGSESNPRVDAVGNIDGGNLDLPGGRGLRGCSRNAGGFWLD